MSIWTIGWIIWGAVTLIGFFAIEIPALLNDRDTRTVMDTLSQHMWLVLRVGPYGKNYDADKDGIPEPIPGYTKIMRLLLLMFFVWLSLHFFTGGWV